MSDAVIEALSEAREAHAAATEALLRAEDAARAAGSDLSTAALEELTVKRLNVVEDDGRLRLVIGGSTVGRTLQVRGRTVEHSHRSPMAGMLFVNDEGTECGGLAFSGRRDEDGVVQWGSLTFDDYEQDETIRVGAGREGEASEQYVEFVDRPDWSLADLVESRGRTDGAAHSRMRLAREQDGSVGLVLRDGAGRDRLRLVVPADGDPVVEVLDAGGAVRSLLPS